MCGISTLPFSVRGPRILFDYLVQLAWQEGKSSQRHKMHNFKLWVCGWILCISTVKFPLSLPIVKVEDDGPFLCTTTTFSVLLPFPQPPLSQPICKPSLTIFAASNSVPSPYLLGNRSLPSASISCVPDLNPLGHFLTSLLWAVLSSFRPAALPHH